MMAELKHSNINFTVYHLLVYFLNVSTNKIFQKAHGKHLCVCEYVKMTFKLFHKSIEMKQSSYKKAGDLV